MIEARVADANLEIVLTGFDGWLISWHSRWTLTVPLEHVLTAKAGPSFELGSKRHVNFPGSDRRPYRGRLVCARFRAPTLRIELDTYPYRDIILSVPDPGRTAEEIQQALRAYRRL
jgi:hypothetical protein